MRTGVLKWRNVVKFVLIVSRLQAALGFERQTSSQDERLPISMCTYCVERTLGMVITQRSFDSPYAKCNGLSGDGHIQNTP